MRQSGSYRLAELEQMCAASSDDYSAGVWCEVANELLAEVHRLMDAEQEPPGAGADPYGRPDPRTHPEFWTE